MLQPSDGGKGAVAWKKRGAGGFSVPYKWHDEDNCACGNIFNLESNSR